MARDEHDDEEGDVPRRRGKGRGRTCKDTAEETTATVKTAAAVSLLGLSSMIMVTEFSGLSLKLHAGAHGSINLRGISPLGGGTQCPWGEGSGNPTHRIPMGTQGGPLRPHGTPGVHVIPWAPQGPMGYLGPRWGRTLKCYVI